MAARKGARYLAPLALVASVAAVYVVVHRQLDGGKKATTTTTPHHISVIKGPQHRAPSSPPVYVVKAGDTLSSISLKTHVPLTTLEALNPNVDANALQTGQRLRLRRP